MGSEKDFDGAEENTFIERDLSDGLDSQQDQKQFDEITGEVIKQKDQVFNNEVNRVSIKDLSEEFDDEFISKAEYYIELDKKQPTVIQYEKYLTEGENIEDFTYSVGELEIFKLRENDPEKFYSDEYKEVLKCYVVLLDDEKKQECFLKNIVHCLSVNVECGYSKKDQENIRESYYLHKPDYAFLGFNPNDLVLGVELFFYSKIPSLIFTEEVNEMNKKSVYSISNYDYKLIKVLLKNDYLFKDENSLFYESYILNNFSLFEELYNESHKFRKYLISNFDKLFNLIDPQLYRKMMNFLYEKDNTSYELANQKSFDESKFLEDKTMPIVEMIHIELKKNYISDEKFEYYEEVLKKMIIKFIPEKYIEFFYSLIVARLRNKYKEEKIKNNEFLIIAKYSIEDLIDIIKSIKLGLTEEWDYTKLINDEFYRKQFFSH